MRRLMSLTRSTIGSVIRVSSEKPKKLCFSCGKKLSFSSFRRDTKNEDGYRRRCKACDARRLAQRSAEKAVAAACPCSTPFTLRIFSAAALAADLAADERVPMSVWNKSLPPLSARFGPVPEGKIHDDFEEHYAMRRAQRYGWVARDHAHDMEAARPSDSPVPRLVPRVTDGAMGANVVSVSSSPPPPHTSAVGEEATWSRSGDDGSVPTAGGAGDGATAARRSHRSAAAIAAERERRAEFAAREAARLERKKHLVAAYAASFPSFDELFEEARLKALSLGRDSWVLHGVEWWPIPRLPRLAGADASGSVDLFRGGTVEADRQGAYVAVNVIGLVSR